MSGDYTHQQLAMTACRRLILLHAHLPPTFSHHLFNHLIGLARDRSRSEKLESIAVAALLIPVAAALASSVKELTVRDMRKNKVEYLFIAPGPFWFHEPAPSSFPRFFPGDTSPYRRLSLPPSILDVATIRTSQASLISDYLQENPREAYTIKKMVESLSLPIMESRSLLNLSLPVLSFSELDRVNRKQQDLTAISLLVARSWLTMLLRLVSGLNRHYNDRPEITRLFESLTLILDAHGDNTTIIGQALHICMIATTRFRRLFSIGDGFSLFIPALFKCFCGANKNQPLRYAIIYAFYSFFRVHEESFVFQALGSIAQVVVSSSEKVLSESAADVFALLESLSLPPPTKVDIAGVVGVNDMEERESLINMINDRYLLGLVQVTCRLKV
jgi:hypothetical protein